MTLREYLITRKSRTETAFALRAAAREMPDDVTDGLALRSWLRRTGRASLTGAGQEAWHQYLTVTRNRAARAAAPPPAPRRRS